MKKILKAIWTSFLGLIFGGLSIWTAIYTQDKSDTLQLLFSTYSHQIYIATLAIGYLICLIIGYNSLKLIFKGKKKIQSKLKRNSRETI